MNSEEELLEFIKNGYLRFLPHLSIDCTVFGYHQNQIKILLTRWKNIDQWCLPGGYILKTESIDDAAIRILKERTGLTNVYLQQYHTFGETNRLKMGEIGKISSIRKFASALLKKKIREMKEDSWLLDRIVSVGYFALVEYSKVIPVADFFSEECKWWDLNDYPKLIFDHEHMITKAINTLRHQLDHRPIGFNLLPAKFTIPELMKLYETILGSKIDRRNFSKKIQSIGVLKRLNENRKIGPHRSPQLYSFDRRNYNKALKNGLRFGF